MADIKNKYELVFIAKANLGEEAMTGLVSKFKDLIASAGTVDAVDEWGKRRLAYAINDEVEGYYVQINFTADNKLPTELDRQLKLSDAVIRSLIVKQDVKKKRHAEKPVAPQAAQPAAVKPAVATPVPAKPAAVKPTAATPAAAKPAVAPGK